jgi:hypothetical protein
MHKGNIMTEASANEVGGGAPMGYGDPIVNTKIDVKKGVDAVGKAKAEKAKSKPAPKAKTLSNSSASQAKANVTDMVVVGNPNAWQVLAKAWSDSEGWMKSTKVMQVGKDCLVQVSTQQRAPDGSSSVAEALQLMPMTQIKVVDIEGTLALVPWPRR